MLFFTDLDLACVKQLQRHWWLYYISELTRLSAENSAAARRADKVIE